MRRPLTILLVSTFALPLPAQQSASSQPQTIQMECRDLATSGNYVGSDETVINGRACHQVSNVAKVAEPTPRPVAQPDPAPSPAPPKDAPVADVTPAPGPAERPAASVQSQGLLNSQPIAGPSTGKIRVYISSASKGSNRNAARDQSMEMAKDFEKNCPDVRITINQNVADYTVLLNHIEQGLFVRDNQIQVANKDGDLITTTKEGGSVKGGAKRACELILADWAKR